MCVIKFLLGKVAVDIAGPLFTGIEKNMRPKESSHTKLQRPRKAI